jgi:hypothetical protein
LQQNFEVDYPDSCKESNTYAKEFLEYCCHKALHEVTTRPDHLADKNLRRLMFDMMLAWEHPGAVVEDELSENVRNISFCSLFVIFLLLRFIKMFIFQQKGKILPNLHFLCKTFTMYEFTLRCSAVILIVL